MLLNITSSSPASLLVLGIVKSGEVNTHAGGMGCDLRKLLISKVEWRSDSLETTEKASCIYICASPNRHGE